MANEDMHPARELLDAYEPVRVLAANTVAAKAFDRYEWRATLWKRLYRALGALALICVGIAALYAGYRLTLAAHYGVTAGLDRAGAIIGGIGLLAQLALIFGGLRDRWLAARFGAERVRCLKFQAFGLLARGRSADLEREVAAFSSAGVAGIRAEMRSGRAAIETFNPALARPKALDVTTDAALLAPAAAAYEQLRVDVQMRHFADRKAHATDKGRAPIVLSEVLFAVASVLTLLDLLLHGFGVFAADVGSAAQLPLLQAWWLFGVWALFVASAVMTIFGQARTQRVDADRYGQYYEEVLLVKARPVGTMQQFVERVAEMEMISLRELQDFCRDQRYFGYIF